MDSRFRGNDIDRQLRADRCAKNYMLNRRCPWYIPSLIRRTSSFSIYSSNRITRSITPFGVISMILFAIESTNWWSCEAKRSTP